MSSKFWAAAAAVILVGVVGLIGWAGVHQGRLWGAGISPAKADIAASVPTPEATPAGQISESARPEVSAKTPTLNAAADSESELEPSLAARARQAARGGTPASFEAAIRLLEQAAATEPLSDEERRLLDAYRLTRRGLDAKGLP